MYIKTAELSSRDIIDSVYYFQMILNSLKNHVNRHEIKAPGKSGYGILNLLQNPTIFRIWDIEM